MEGKTYLKLEETLDITEYIDSIKFPISVEFLESGLSGSAHYNYVTDIKVFSKNENVLLSYKEIREFIEPKPRLVVANEKKISTEIYKEFLIDLLNRNVSQLNRNFIFEKKTEERENFFLLNLGDTIKFRFDYQQSHKDLPEFEPFEDIVQSLKNLLFSNFP